jgi:hypothetical protein
MELSLSTMQRTEGRFLVPAQLLDVTFLEVSPAPMPEVTDKSTHGYFHRMKTRTRRLNLTGAVDQTAVAGTLACRDPQLFCELFEYHPPPKLTLSFSESKAGAQTFGESAATRCGDESTAAVDTQTTERWTGAGRFANGGAPGWAVATNSDMQAHVRIEQVVQYNRRKTLVTDSCSEVRGDVHHQSYLGLSSTELATLDSTGPEKTDLLKVLSKTLPTRVLTEPKPDLLLPAGWQLSPAGLDLVRQAADPATKNDALASAIDQTLTVAFDQNVLCSDKAQVRLVWSRPNPNVLFTLPLGSLVCTGDFETPSNVAEVAMTDVVIAISKTANAPKWPSLIANLDDPSGGGFELEVVRGVEGYDSAALARCIDTSDTRCTVPAVSSTLSLFSDKFGDDHTCVGPLDGSEAVPTGDWTRVRQLASSSSASAGASEEGEEGAPSASDGTAAASAASVSSLCSMLWLHGDPSKNQKPVSTPTSSYRQWHTLEWD